MEPLVGGGIVDVPGALEAPVPGALEAPVPGALEAPVPGALEAPVPGALAVDGGITCDAGHHVTN